MIEIAIPTIWLRRVVRAKRRVSFREFLRGALTPLSFFLLPWERKGVRGIDFFRGKG
jgi:hypothetical protein